jgi:hypothetical protein
MGHNFVWHSSLPRSGSTLLQNLVAQCDSNYVTATSGIAELVVLLRNKWVDVSEFKAQGLDKCVASMKSAIKGFIEGYYRDQINTNKIVWEKSRGWIGYAKLLDEVFGEKQKIVCCVRDVREIIASFETMHQSNQMTKKDNIIPAPCIEARTSQLLAIDGVVGQSIAMLRDCIRSDFDRLIIIPYNKLCQDPLAVIAKLHTELNLPVFEVDPTKIIQKIQEDDNVWGISNMHTVRDSVSRNDDKWPDILPLELAEFIEYEYRDINQLARAN